MVQEKKDLGLLLGSCGFSAFVVAVSCSGERRWSAASWTLLETLRSPLCEINFGNYP